MSGQWIDCAGFGVFLEDRLEPEVGEDDLDIPWPYDEQADGFETEMYGHGPQYF